MPHICLNAGVGRSARFSLCPVLHHCDLLCDHGNAGSLSCSSDPWNGEEFDKLWRRPLAVAFLSLHLRQQLGLTRVKKPETPRAVLRPACMRSVPSAYPGASRPYFFDQSLFLLQLNLDEVNVSGSLELSHSKTTERFVCLEDLRVLSARGYPGGGM